MKISSIMSVALMLIPAITLAAELHLTANETKILYKKDLDGGVFFRLDSLVMDKGSKLIIGEQISAINIHIKSLVAAENTEIDLSGRRVGNNGAIGTDNNSQATYCHAGPSGGAGGRGGDGQPGINTAMLVDIKRVDGLTINVSGANGGNGGPGGRGGRGGGRRSVRLCSEGDGGWGGNGGDGGRGGNAGELHFRWRNNDPTVCWKSETDIPPRLTIRNSSGSGGIGGAGGAGGLGRHTGSTGHSGSNGAAGAPGYLKVERIPSTYDAGICK